MTCSYCGKVNPQTRCFIGYAPVDRLDPEGETFAWVLWEGTGETSCDSRDCWAKGHARREAAFKKL